MTKKRKTSIWDKAVEAMKHAPSVLVANEPVTKPTYEQLEESVDYLTEHLAYANEQHDEVVKRLGESRVNFTAAYNALRNIRLYLRKHVDDIPYEHRDTLKRFCDEGGVTDTVLRASSSDLADVAFPPEET